MPPDSADRLHDAARARVAAAMLSTGSVLDAWSRTLVLPALLWPAIERPEGMVLGAFALSLCAAAAQAFCAWRTRLDTAIFSGWASAWSRPSGLLPADDLRLFDRALADWTQSRAATGDCRPLDARLHGARRLLARQAMWLSLQAATLLGTVLLVAATA
ncbi:hypothetical protein [Aromatoleum evansii]|uniref:hypothetical protein n=1 Tax=Aromatoleum evansii TaxID=59406 RepID=UPI00145EBA8A|nr:hypothetical protein [Aromatoleum evansii]NMG31697.1 hypothetical protein [Aromatoleum evansii]